MAQENLETVRAGIEAFNRRDLAALLQAMHPDGEWCPVMGQAEGGEGLGGHDGLREWWANTDPAFDEVEIEISDVRDLGDRVASLGRT